MQIKFDNVSFKYNEKMPNEHEALSNVSVEINEGSFTCLVGETGSGKSTFVQHINGLLLPTEGTVCCGDIVLSDNKKIRSKNYKLLRESIGLVFQFPEQQIFAENVFEEISFGPKNFGVKNEELKKRVDEAIAYVGLDESFLNRSPFDLSGGEKRKVAIAGVLACQPRVLIMDEPTAGLDKQSAAAILSLLSRINKHGVTIIVVTHDMDLVIKYAEQVILLEKGSITFDGKPSDLFNGNISESSIEIPSALKFAYSLKEGGFAGKFDNIKDIDDLCNAIAEGVKK